MSDRTSYQRAASGYDAEHEQALVEALTDAVARTSMASDVNAMVLRTAELTSALTTMLASALALSPGVTRSPATIRHAVDEIAKRLRARIANDKASADDFRRHCFTNDDEQGGHA